jgi:3-oxoacyl-[acyl-carrier-protein] synthase II
MAPTRPRVVVTGIGLLSALGAGREATWRGVRLGRAVFTPFELGDDVSVPVARVPLDPPAPPGVEPCLHLAGLAAREALGDAGCLDAGRRRLREAVDPNRVAVLVGLSKGGLSSLRSVARASAARDHATESPAWPSSWPSAAAAHLAAWLGLGGPCAAPIAACATGLVAVLQASALIRRGACDVALAGAVDSTLDPLMLAAFRRMGVLARDEGEGRAAVRPWDRRRTGFLVGEGGAILVLERSDHARARGVQPYVELAGGALGSDAHHITDLNPDPSTLARLIGIALESSGVAPAEIDHVNVHGTATRTNDPLECRAIRRALGAHADRVACSANKAQIGHLLGAAGAAELAITCLAIRDGFVPPTLNLDEPDPACDLDGTPGVGRARSIGAALKLSLGFGGHLAAAVLRRCDDARPALSEAAPSA